MHANSSPRTTKAPGPRIASTTVRIESDRASDCTSGTASRRLRIAWAPRGECSLLCLPKAATSAATSGSGTSRSITAKPRASIEQTNVSWESMRGWLKGEVDLRTYVAPSVDGCRNFSTTAFAECGGGETKPPRGHCEAPPPPAGSTGQAAGRVPADCDLAPGGKDDALGDTSAPGIRPG